MTEPVLVTGVGRSGTSAVARVLHEQLGVCMGHDLPKPKRANPEGSYEDKEIRNLHIQVTNGRIDRGTFEERAIQWLEQHALDHQTTYYRNWYEDGRPLLVSRAEPWGFKDPRACHVLDFYLELPIDWKLIVCERAFEDVLASWGRVCAGTTKGHRQEIRARGEALEGAIDAHGVEPVRLDMTERRPDAWIREKLAPEVEPRGEEPVG